MHCLRNLELSILTNRHIDCPSQHSVPEDTVPMSELTRFQYLGHNTFLDNLMAGFSAPSLRDARFMLYNLLPISHIPRLIDGLREQYSTANVTFNRNSMDDFHLSLLTHSGDIEHFKPFFRFHANHFPKSIEPITDSRIFSTKLATAEELALIFPDTAMVTEWQNDLPLREFLRQFRSVRVLRLDPFVPEVALALRQDNGESFLPLLEEIVLSAPPIPWSTIGPDEEYQHRSAAELAAFKQFVSARERVGRPVYVFHREMPRPD